MKTSCIAILRALVGALFRSNQIRMPQAPVSTRIVPYPARNGFTEIAA